MNIRRYTDLDREAVVRLSLRAWEPVFVSLMQALSAELYQEFYPDWRDCQRKAVEAACADGEMKVWVALESGEIAGFAAARMLPDRLGEIHMLAVDPDFQRRGIAKALSEIAVEWMREAGATIAMVETGADPGHAPARQTYEKCGFDPLPCVRYFKKI